LKEEVHVMGEVSQYPHGTFCWVDLETTDVPTAKAFYAGLFGWDMEDLPSGETTYTMCRLHGKDVAAIYPGPGPGRPQYPPHWNSYIAVTDLDFATSQAKGLGASMIAEPFDVMDTGRMAVIQDATGAVVNLWEPKPFSGARLVNEVGAWSWNELVTPDIEGAKAFYTALLGWQAADVPAGFPRASFTLGRFLIGGVHVPTKGEGEASRWEVSFRVADVDATAELARDLGGQIQFPPMDIPVGRFSVIRDPTGAALTITAFPAGPVRGVDGS
jgi:predicted enzyme related to lactoylglutathione lyase